MLLDRSKGPPSVITLIAPKTSSLTEMIVVTSTKKKVGVISGASVYPLVWNTLLAARNEGFGGTITTMAVAEEPAVKELLGIPDQYAVAAVVPIGKPAREITLRPARCEAHTTAVAFRAVSRLLRAMFTVDGLGDADARAHVLTQCGATLSSDSADAQILFEVMGIADVILRRSGLDPESRADVDIIRQSAERGIAATRQYLSGAASGQALAGVVGPLIEVPVLVGLVYVSLALRTRLFRPEPDRGTGSDGR